MAHKSARRNRAVWDRPATDTRLLLRPRSIPVSLGNPLDPLRMSIITSAPSRPTCPQRHRAADARVPSPRMITHGSYPQRACPTTVDARVLSRMNSRSALLGVEADACGIAPRMISRFTLLGVEADACGIAPRMTSRFTLLGVEADACGIAPRMISRFTLLGVEADACGIAPRMTSRFTLLGVEADACGIAPRMTSRFTLLGVEADACGIAPRMTSRVPTLRAAARAAEGALAPFILTLSPSLSLCPSSFHRGDRPIALGWSIPARPQLAESGTSAITGPLRRIEGSQERNVSAVSGTPTHRKEPT